jgi:hypothetical protein
MVSTPDYLALFEKIGDMQATLRVVKHETSNTSAKLDALATLVATQGHMAADVERLKEEVHELQVDKHRREGAIGLFEWISKHWPFTIFAAALGALVAWANGRLHL